jgi:DNA modification methylase
MTTTKPYYEDDRVTLYCGDCREILPTLGRFDLLLTDPPYGIGTKWQGGSGHGWGRADLHKTVRNKWDAKAPELHLLHKIIAATKVAIIWGGNYFELPPARCFLVWNKPERNFTLAEAEYAWTNADNVARVCDYRRSDPDRTHPTQKPLGLMKWCLNLSWSKHAETILDPFAGSGTTGVAAKLEGRKATLIEMEERYCEIAAKRLSQGTLF